MLTTTRSPSIGHKGVHDSNAVEGGGGKETVTPPFVSAAPIDEGNIFLWRAVLAGTPTVDIVLDLTFTPDYRQVPKLRVPHARALQHGRVLDQRQGPAGALPEPPRGRGSHRHREWAQEKGDAHGWSPATTVASLLVNLHALLLSGDEVPFGSPEWVKAAETAKSFKDAATGHDGRNPATWWPPVKEHLLHPYI